VLFVIREGGKDIVFTGGGRKRKERDKRLCVCAWMCGRMYERGTSKSDDPESLKDSSSAATQSSSPSSFGEYLAMASSSEAR